MLPQLKVRIHRRANYAFYLCIKFLQIISTDAMEERDVIDGSKQTGDRSNQRQRDGRGRNLSD